MQTRAYLNPAACKGCGACVAVCPNGAIDVQGWEIEQYLAMVDAIVAESPSEPSPLAPKEAVPA
jgi:heterodisulfide reductase subunit A-like polyferredoxin